MKNNAPVIDIAHSHKTVCATIDTIAARLGQPDTECARDRIRLGFLLKYRDYLRHEIVAAGLCICGSPIREDAA